MHFREENEVESTPTTPAIEIPNDVTLATLTTATPTAQAPGNQTTAAVLQSHDQAAVVLPRDQSAVVMPRDQSADSVAARLSSNEQPKEEVKTKDETKI